MRCCLVMLVVMAACARTVTVAPSDDANHIDAATPPRPTMAPPWTDEWMLAEGELFLNDVAARRAALERSLVNPNNVYSRQRLASYALGTRGWDALPVWNPRSTEVTAAIAAQLATGALPTLAADTKRLWDGVVPTTMAEWVALGRRVFFEFPMRAEVYMEYALTDRKLADAVGVERTSDGTVPGLVVFTDVDGRNRVGITCAVCHTELRDGQLVVGAARRRFDYGQLRLQFFKKINISIDARLSRQMASWGPGRADVTEDDDEDPVAIPDLWGLRSQSALTQAGTIRHENPMALAIRQDTQLLHSNHQRIRPPRELAWALAMFVYSLEPPARAIPDDEKAVSRGKELFAKSCAGCHRNSAYGGNPIDAAKVGTDASLANGHGRGTGHYRIPPLLDVGNGAPYLHHGDVASLEELLSPERLSPNYKAGMHGPGAIVGHAFGTQLPVSDRNDLIDYLKTL